MRILELYSGTKSFSKVAEERGHIVFTIDINPRFKPDLIKDIMELDIKDIPFHPDIIWASPPCEQYSHAKRRGKRNIKYANKLVNKTREIIKQLKPKYWFMENPQTGLLKKQPILNTIYSQLPYFDVSYCKYGMPYRKQTRIWSNLDFVGEVCHKDCNFMNGKKHIGSAGNGRKEYTNKSYKRTEKYQIPKELCLKIIKFIELKQSAEEGEGK